MGCLFPASVLIKDVGYAGPRHQIVYRNVRIISQLDKTDLFIEQGGF